MRILLLSAYDAKSHQYWREGLVAQFPNYEWTQLVLPGRYFSWRIRGNSMQWALGERSTLEQPYDLVIATSMVDLASLKGFVSNLANIPSILYFHENQFVYPPSQANAKHHLDPKMVSLYAALAADRLVFNSQYNQQSFSTGVEDLLNQLPEKMPVNVVELLGRKSCVLPVPIASLDTTSKTLKNNEPQQTPWPKPEDGSPLRLVWAARWEYDKGPQQLQAILQELRKRGVDFQLCVLGQKFRQQPIEFNQIKAEFATNLVQFGYAASRQHYLNWLEGADMILSTALHEFQGLAVLEAVQLGCIPILPNRLVYAEIFGLKYVYESTPEDRQKESIAAVNLIQKLALGPKQGNLAKTVAQSLAWPTMKHKYHQLLNFKVSKAPERITF